MATFTHTVPPELVDEMIEALCLEGGYYSQLEVGDVLPEDLPSKVDFAKEVLGNYPKQVLRKYRKHLRRKAAQVVAASEAATDQADMDSLTIA